MKNSPLLDQNVLVLNRTEYRAIKNYGWKCRALAAVLIIGGALAAIGINEANAQFSQETINMLNRFNQTVEIRTPDNINYTADVDPYTGELTISYSEMERVRAYRETLNSGIDGVYSGLGALDQ